jgi:ParB/RepB/Spo0J family partition protein
MLQSGLREGNMNVTHLPVASIHFDPNQPRKEFDGIPELARSIAEEGLIQPIEVTKEQDGSYMVVDGERRLRAFIFLKEKEIPCIVKEEQLTDRFLRQLVTDFHKRKLTIIEQADAIQRLLEAGHTAEEIQQLLAIGVNQYYILKRIPEFNPKTQALIREGKLSQNQLSTISRQDILRGKEDEIVAEIVAGRSQDVKVIEQIIHSKQDLRFLVNKYLTELYYFGQKTRHLTEQIQRNGDEMVGLAMKQHVKDQEGRLKEDIRLLQERLAELQKRL